MNNTKPIIYFISGLAADHRAYMFMDFNEYVCKYIEWVKFDESDTLGTYANKLIPQIDTTKPIVLIGTSLGGMIATEIAKQIKVDHVFLISSIKNIDEQPSYFNLFRNIPVHKLLTDSMLNSPSFFMKLLFPAGLKQEWKTLFADMFNQWSPAFLRWAMNAALHWDNKFTLENCTHIHGNRDIVFPHKKIKKYILIEGGTHIMVLSKSREIKAIIEKQLDNLLASKINQS